MDQSKKERLRRLSEMNRRALGVSSFEAPEAEPVMGCGSSTTRELLMTIREKKGYICRSQIAGRAGNDGKAWVRKYYGLFK